MTPLHWAAFHNIEENVSILLQHGATATLLDHEHKTPLHWAAQVCNDIYRMRYKGKPYSYKW